MDRLIFRLATPDDDPDIQDLYKASFGHESVCGQMEMVQLSVP